MYNSHYNFMVRKFNTKLLFTDMDNLRYQNLINRKAHLI